MTGEQQMSLAGKIALVTGSGQGIGRATAQRLARNGADVIINYRSNVKTAEETKASIEALGRRCIAIQADVSQEEDVNRLFAEASQVDFPERRAGRWGRRGSGFGLERAVTSFSDHVFFWFEV